MTILRPLGGIFLFVQMLPESNGVALSPHSNKVVGLNPLNLHAFFSGTLASSQAALVINACVFNALVRQRAVFKGVSRPR